MPEENETNWNISPFKWTMVGAAVYLSVWTTSLILDTCFAGLRWWLWGVLLVNAAWWQGLGISAWRYWTAIEERDSARPN